MKTIKNNSYKLITVMLLFAFSITSATAQNSKSNKSIEDVINTFKAALMGDASEAEFYDLFLHENITWAAILEGKSKEMIQPMPTYKPAYHMHEGGAKAIMEDAKKYENGEEKFYNIDIDQDNNFATVKFDYLFQQDEDKIINWGKELWTLVKVEGQWKITTVLWTLNYSKHEKCPFPNSSYYKE